MDDNAGPSGIQGRYKRKQCKPLTEEELRHIPESEDGIDNFFPESDDEYLNESDKSDSDDDGGYEIENIDNELMETTTTSLTHNAEAGNLHTWTSQEVIK